MRITADIIDEEGGMTCGRGDQKTKIFVEKLPDGYTDEDLRALFSKYGEVTECHVINKYGFVYMASAEQAEKAIKNLNNCNLKSPDISKGVSPFIVKIVKQIGEDMIKERLAEKKPCKIVVGNLPVSCTEDDLRNLFSKYGEVTEPFVYYERNDKLCGRKAGCLFLANGEQAQDAIKNLNNSYYKGSNLIVEHSYYIPNLHNDILRDMCSKFRNLNISSSELNESYPSFEGIAAAVPEKKVLISNLPPGCNFGRLNELFSNYGAVVEGHFIGDNAAILTMKTPKEAEAAIKNLHGVNFLGSKIEVKPARPDIRSLSDKVFQEKYKPEIEIVYL